MLKLDPENTDLLAQKQSVLAEAINNTADKLKALKEAEKQVQKQFERGEVSADQVRALRREILDTTLKLEGYGKAVEETADAAEKAEQASVSLSKTVDNQAKLLENLKAEYVDVIVSQGKNSAAAEQLEEEIKCLSDELRANQKRMEEAERAADEAAGELDDYADSAEKAEKASGGLSEVAGAVGKGLTVVTGLVAAAVTALVGAAEASRDYRREMGKLSTAFGTAGHNAEAATQTYKDLQGILGETDQAVEASGHLAKLCDTEEELAKMTEAATGVYATFGASLPIENLAEASNETAKTGKITGGLADALNWAGVSEEEFQASLDACSDEQERQTLIIDTLNGLYAEAARQYRETNAEVIRANEANEEWSATLAEIGGEVEPILTDVKLLGASLVREFIPDVKEATEAFRGMLDGVSGAAEDMGESLAGMASRVLQRITGLLPQAAGLGVSLVTSLTTAIVAEIPSLVESISGTLVGCSPQLIDGATQLLMAILSAVGVLITSEQFAEAIPEITMSIINGLLGSIPQLIDGAATLLLAICDAIPLLTRELVPLIPEIVTAVRLALLDCSPELLKTALTLFMALQNAIPLACLELVKALPEVGKTIFSYFKKLPDEAMDIGADLVEGLWNGIQNMDDWIMNKIKGFGNGILNGIKDFFDIHSPSRVFRDDVGKMLALGLAEGIEDNAGQPLDAMNRLSADMLHEAEDMNGLTLERNLRHTFSPPATASAAESGMLDKLDRILRAIERGQVITINGDTLVGATANKMNNALGQRRVLAERGAV